MSQQYPLTNLMDLAFKLLDEDEGLGLCFKCRHTQPSDYEAIKEKCEECGDNTVYSPHEFIQRVIL